MIVIHDIIPTALCRWKNVIRGYATIKLVDLIGIGSTSTQFANQ